MAVRSTPKSGEHKLHSRSNLGGKILIPGTTGQTRGLKATLRLPGLATTLITDRGV